MLSDWLVYFAIPGILVGFAIVGGALGIAYLAIRCLLVFVAPSKGHLASSCYGYLWSASLLALSGFLISELGYQLNFWEAPGIWGAPGKEATLWEPLQYILPPSGFALGIALNAVLEQRQPGRARSVRIGVAVLASLLLIATSVLSAWHAMETMG